MKKFFAIIVILILFTAFIVLNGCNNESTSLLFPKPELPVVLFQGFNIPQFPTAQGQLNYAKSGFPDANQKRTAFEFIFHIFPKEREECGEAALYLAYMNLGLDYRFATKKDFTNAILAYRDVIKTYKGYPQILVKANWYLGWIYCDLLKEKKAGIPYYWQIVKTYPNIEMGISSPVPWVSLVYPITPKGAQPAKKKTKTQWASVSLLEIVRHATDKIEVYRAFDLLWENYQYSVSTGLAIKLLLKNENHLQKVLPYIKKYVDLNVANTYLAKEIQDSAREY
ncbi:MAG: hypothetical protein L3J69_01200 [Desulfobacula sp.]|nr:hypothetical protein [Desulfobacula sp.]